MLDKKTHIARRENRKCRDLDPKAVRISDGINYVFRVASACERMSYWRGRTSNRVRISCMLFFFNLFRDSPTNEPAAYVTYVA